MEWRGLGFDWNRVRAFLVAAEEGTFSGAARALGVAQPTVGRQVSSLEEELGVRLFERGATRLALTEPGLRLLEHAREMGEAALGLSRVATGASVSLEGAVAITASELISAYLLAPALAEIRTAHPAIELELVVSNAARDLRRREADVAVRNFRPTQPELVAQKAGDSAARLYASPAYLERLGPVTSPADLARAEFFAFDRSELMIDGLRALGIPVSRAHFPIVCEGHLVQWSLAKSGLGICVVMEEVGDADPDMRRVLPELPPLPVPLWIVAHDEVRTSRRVRVVFDALARALRSRGAGLDTTSPGVAR